MTKPQGQVITSLGLGLVLLYLFLLLSNLNIPISSENLTLKWWFKITSSDEDAPLPADLLLINVSYDRELRDIYDEDSFPIGNIDITDRGKLIEFLKMAKLADYKYIMMDIRFTADVAPESDDTLLWEMISQTPRIVIPKHPGVGLADKSLAEKAAYAGYNITIMENDFLKYPLMIDDEMTMAWRPYSLTTASDRSDFLGLSFMQGRIMRRSFIPDLTILDSESSAMYAPLKVYSLGANILNDPDNYVLLSDKYIVIGDFKNQDTHPTYRGLMHGPTIQANAMYNLIESKHLMSWWTVLTLWLAFSLSFYVVIYPPRIIKRIMHVNIVERRAANSRKWRALSNLYQVLLSIMGFGSFYTLLLIMIYTFTGQIYELLLVGALFTILSSLFNINNTHKCNV